VVFGQYRALRLHLQDSYETLTLDIEAASGVRRQTNTPKALTTEVPVIHEESSACNNGRVSIGQLVVDPETGEETEETALYLCRRCADAK
jgi:hypothetical protein